MYSKSVWIALAIGVVLCWPVAAALGLTNAPDDFRDAYYLETHEHDLAGAIAAYERVVKAGDSPKEVVAEAKTRIASCREDLRAADLAALMPADAIAFVEFRRPGDHLEHVADMLGLTQAVRDAGGEGYAIPGEPGLRIPRQIKLSAAVIGEIKAFQGMAVAVTDINFEQERPEGLLVFHPGDVDIVRGLIETGAQFVQPGAPVAGFSTIEIHDPDVDVTIAFTHRLVIAGTQRALVTDAVNRLVEGGGSLADDANFRAQTDRRGDALLYAFVNAPEALKRLYQVAGKDRDMMQGLMMGQAFLDLAHLHALSLTIGTTADGLHAEFVMAMDAAQTNMAYNLLRTPPMRGAALRQVPAGAAAVVAIGINPADDDAGKQQVLTKTQTVQAITGLDLGRELFANIREAAVFMIPPDGSGEARPGSEIPDAALVMVVGDPAKSAALWDFLLTLPAKAMGKADIAPQVSTVAGVEVREYPIEQGISVHFARTDGGIVVASSRAAIAASLDAGRKSGNMLDDRGLQNATARIGEETSIAAIGHVGRIARIAASMAPPRDAAEFGMMAEVAADATATLTIDETPTRLRVTGQINGLPKVERILEILAKAGALVAEPSYVAADDAAVVTVE
ncbi:MAG: DUF3352 domain-containing protein [Phycisphaerales bacterium]|nr:DUF3352 domain-containing protein [Phycisphaerales bacterium]